MIEKHVDQYGVFQAGERPQKQSGVLRINCIDCLDRTNVVQGWLARRQLDRLLTQMGLLAPGSSIRDTFPEVQQSGSQILQSPAGHLHIEKLAWHDASTPLVPVVRANVKGSWHFWCCQQPRCMISRSL